MAFRCTIVTPDEQAFDQQVEQVILPGHDGLVGILTNRAPLLMRVDIGPMQIDLPGGRQLHYFVEGGVAQMRENQLTVITNTAIPSGEISPAEAEAELQKAQAMPFEGRENRDARARALKRAHGKLAVAGK